MRKPLRHTTLAIAMAGGLCCTSVAHAGIPVFDAVNGVSNIIQNFQLAAIKHSLAVPEGGDTINHYTSNIDQSTSNIDNSIIKNTEITADFTWIISHGKDEIVPIPREVSSKLKALLGGATSDEYAARFHSAQHYIDLTEQGDVPAVSLEGSRARKAANDALVKSIEVDQLGLTKEAALVKELADLTRSTSGHGHQLQIANALAGTEVDQLMRMRSMMLVSEAARAADSQAAADKEARAIATSNAMRADISDARDQTIRPRSRPTY